MDISVLLILLFQIIGGIFLMLIWNVQIKKLGFQRFSIGWIIGMTFLTSINQIVEFIIK